jgi:hypothetical protein
MYRGFNVKLSDKDLSEYARSGQNTYNESFEQLKKTFNYKKIIDGSALQEEWFPQIKKDIFISHSHKNKDLAIRLAGFIRERFKLTSFIDSCLWGYSNELLRQVDDQCTIIDKVEKRYSYSDRNDSTSHVHMMLSMALTTMIDRTECFFFLNTPEAVKAYSESDKTESPWIYSEIMLSKMIRRRQPERDIKGRLYESYLSERSKLKMVYNLDLSHLVELDHSDLLIWNEIFRGKQHPLDDLYLLY